MIRFNVSFPEDLLKKVDELCLAEYTDRSEFIRQVVRERVLGQAKQGTDTNVIPEDKVKKAVEMKFKTMCFNCKRIESCQKVEREDENGNQLGGWICDNCKVKWDSRGKS